MPTTTHSIATLVVFSILLSQTYGQNKFNELNPADVQVQKSDQHAPVKRTLQAPPIQNSAPAAVPKTVFENDLRGSHQTQPPVEIAPTGTPPTQENFSSQPTPPSPRNFNQQPQNRLPQQPQNQSPQNPINQLNPARLVPNFPKQTPTNQVDPNRFSASSIPGNTPSSRRSIQTPTATEDDSQIIVAAGFENDSMINNRKSNPPVVMSNPRNNAGTIKDIISSYSIANNPQTLPGVPTELVEMLTTTDPTMRLRMVQQYWETYFDWATLQNRQRFETWLGQLPASRSRTDQLLLQTAKSMAKNETLAAEIQLARSQSKLQEFSNSNPEAMLPLPANAPVCSKYITHYQWYATRRLVPAKLKGINEMLPRTYQLLNQRAATVGQAVLARNQTVQALTSGQASMASVLESGRAWRSSLQSVVSTVVSYNKAISDYALTITPAQKPVTEIASMLVSKPTAQNISAPPADVSTQRNASPRNSVLQRQARRNANPAATGSQAGPFQPANSVPTVVPQNPAVPFSTRSVPGNNAMSNPNIRNSTNAPNQGANQFNTRPASRNFGAQTSSNRNGIPGTGNSSGFVASPARGSQGVNSNASPNASQQLRSQNNGQGAGSGGSSQNNSFPGGGSFGG